MRKMFVFIGVCVLLQVNYACNKDLLKYESGDLRVEVEKGENWLHDFPLFMGIKKKNPPQIAIWLEDTLGNYLSTVYVTHKIATQSWQAAGKNRRKEALPHWCYSRNVQYEDNLYLPTKKSPFVDGLTGATPQGSFDVRLKPLGELEQFIVKIEINHSTDFNDFYLESAEEGTSGYSGGDKGSGQPALVYVAPVNMASGKTKFEAALIGHSSADGTNGRINEDISTLTTALDIVKRITVNVQ